MRQTLTPLEFYSPSQICYHLDLVEGNHGEFQHMELHSPIRRLPTELLVESFSYIAEDFGANPDAVSKFAQVCVHWKDVAIDNPSLWSNIFLSFPITTKALKYTSIYLQNSGDYPLSITLDLRNENCWDEDIDSEEFLDVSDDGTGEPETGVQDIVNVMSLILEHSERWRNIEVLSDTWKPIYAFLRFAMDIGSSARMLESISLSRCNQYLAAKGQAFEPRLLGMPLPFFGGAHLDSLQRLTFIGVHVEWGQFRLQNLTHLEFKYHAERVMPTLEDFRSMLSACPQLAYLSIHGWGPILPDSPALDLETSRLRLPNLNTFSSSFVDARYAKKLIKLLDMPNVQRLILEDHPFLLPPFNLMCNSEQQTPFRWIAPSHSQLASSSRPPTQLLPIFHLSFPRIRLKSLELNSLHFSKDHFILFFSGLLSLEQLVLLDMHDSKVLDILITSRDLGQSNLLPSLRELHCRDLDPDKLIKVAHSRSIEAQDDTQQTTTIKFTPPLEMISIEFSTIPAPIEDSDTYAGLMKYRIAVFARRIIYGT